MKLLKEGIPLIEEYNYLLKNKSYLEMEKFSNKFLLENQKTLDDYGKRWVRDPFHQWSRQWEYPFAFSYIQDYLNGSEGDVFSKNVLDVGSGVTFFPYYLVVNDKLNLDCFDLNNDLKSIYEQINQKTTQSVNFYHGDIHRLPFSDESYDVLYCISVIEHCVNHRKIVQELNRVLKRNGRLIVTFDISLDGFTKVSVPQALELIYDFSKYFNPAFDFEPTNYLDQLANGLENQILTTRYIKEYDESLLPKWSNTLWSKFTKVLKFKNPFYFPLLTCFCLVFEKNS